MALQDVAEKCEAARADINSAAQHLNDAAWAVRLQHQQHLDDTFTALAELLRQISSVINTLTYLEDSKEP